MGTAAIRRIAFVAVLFLLAPIWCRPSPVVEAFDSSAIALVGLTPGGAGTVPAIRRHAPGAWWSTASRLEHGRTLAALGLLAMISALGLVLWARLDPTAPGSPAVGRRRHVISLRAPPRLCCI